MSSVTRLIKNKSLPINLSLKQEKMISLEQLSNNNELKIMLAEQQDKTKLIVNNFLLQ